MADIPLSWKLGIDQVSLDTNLPDGAVRDCVNVDIDRTGTLDRRAGYALTQALTGGHSLWTSPARGDTFCVAAGALKHVVDPLTLTTLYALTSDVRLSYDDLNTDVVCGNRGGLLAIAPDFSVRTLGIETPGAPGVTAGSAGGLYAGRYGVVVTFLRGYEESGASAAAWADLTDGQGLSLALPQPTASDVTAIRIYRTQANGDVFYRAVDAPLAATPYLVGVGEVGRQCDTRSLDPLPGGQIVRYWKGRVLVARGRNLLFSDAMRYGLFDATQNFVQFPRRIRVLQPVEKGVFVGTADGVTFLAGTTPDAWEARRTDGLPPVDGSGLAVPSALLGSDHDYGGAHVAMWLAQNGVVVGTADGALLEPQAKRINLPDSQVAAGAGAVVIHDRRFLVSII